MDMLHADVVIIGGGASGLAAAAELRMSSADLDVLVIEKNEEAARKIRATGSGRCNITNTSATGYAEIVRFFGRLGLVTRAYENGLVYPYSESAADVAELLVARCEELGVRIITGAEVTAVRCLAHGDNSCYTSEDYAGAADGFITEFIVKNDSSLYSTSYSLEKGDSKSSKDLNASSQKGYLGKSASQGKAAVASDFVVLATGGKAGPMYGTTGDGYRLARELGHTIVTPVPVLTSIECAEWEPKTEPWGMTLAGTRTRGTVTLYKNGARTFEEAGEIQFTKYGLSGICVFNMTRFMRYDRNAGESLSNFVVKTDLFPDGDIRGYLRERRESEFCMTPISDVLCTVLKKNIAEYVIRTAERKINASGKGYMDRELPVATLTDGNIDVIAETVHALEFHPKGIRGWKEAQATSGGVSLDEIDADTAESKLVPGLYITGELADNDFPCGGFNLSNAWLTGIAAADSIVNAVMS